MQARRKVLLFVALIMGFADVSYILWLRFDAANEMKAAWVAYMPKLEAKQRRNPYNFLESSHSRDPDYPSLYINDGGEAFPLFSKIAHDCDIREYTINRYVGPTPENPALQMPDRLFLGPLSTTMASCLRRALPKGYVLVKLPRRVIPRRTGWGESDLLIERR